MTLSIITPTFNSASTIRDTLHSVASQDYQDIEHIIIDGGSSDNTIQIVKEFSHVSQFISEADDGLYDAINKGINLAKGEVIGILNSDDFFAHKKVLSHIAKTFEATTTDCVFGDVVYVQNENPKKVIRHYSSKHFHPGKFAWGYMPAHPTFYLRKSHYQTFGLHNTKYRIAADFELLLRMLYVHRLNYTYLNDVFVHMRAGGISNASFQNRMIINQEILRACQDHNIHTNLPKLYFRYLRKALEYWRPQKKQDTYKILS